MDSVKTLIDALRAENERLANAAEKAIAALLTETPCRAKCDDCKVTDAVSDLRVALSLSGQRQRAELST